MCSRMCKLVFFVVSVSDCDENAEIVGTRCYSNAGARKLSTELVEASSRQAFFWAIDEKCGHRRMM